MAQIAGYHKKFLILCGLLLLTIGVVSAVELTTEIPQELEKNETNHFELSPTQIEAYSLVSLIPNITIKLSHIASASMGQLDSAFNWPAEIPMTEETNITTESSPLIEYPQSFRTTVMQINQQFTKALRAINSNADRMALQVASVPSYIDTLNRYLSQYPQKASLFASFLPLPLNGLKDLSEKSILLSNESSIELQRVADLTKVFGETAKAIHSAKLRYMENKLNGSISKEIDEITNQKNEVEKEINTMNEEVEKMNRNATESEQKFYQMLNETQQTIQEKKQKGEKLSCYETRLKEWNSPKDQKLKIKDCKEKAKADEIKTINTLRGIKNQWNTTLANLTTIEGVLATKRETKHNLSITFQKLEFKKNRLANDISLLVNTENSIDELGKEMENLVISWKNLTSKCQHIQSDVVNVRATLLPDNTSDVTKISVPNQEQLTLLNPQLTKIREDMNRVGKSAKFYVKAYESNLSSLAAQLDQMMTISNVFPATLERNLIMASTNASRNIEEMLKQEFQA